MNISSKRGKISRLTLNLLISFFIVVLVVVIWFALKDEANKEDYSLNDSSLDLKILEVKKVDDSKLNVTIKRNMGEGDFVGLSFSVDDGNTTEIIRVNSSILENQDGNFVLEFSLINASNLEKISITPIFETESGEEIIGTTKDEYHSPVCFPDCPYGSECGNDGCGGNCGSGCDSGYSCINYKCIKDKISSSSSGGGGSSSSSTTTTCTDTCSSLGYTCGYQTICSQSVNCGSCEIGYYCSSGNCTSCITHSSFNCSEGDVYWWDNCGTLEGIKEDCNSTQTCSNGECVNDEPPPLNQGTIIIDHTSTNVSKIPLSCINKIKTDLHVAYSHTSHGSQLYTGMLALESWNSSYGIDFNGSGGQLHFEDYYGYGDDSGFATGGCYDLSACDDGGDGLLGPTREFLDSVEGQDINVILWSWCSIAGHNITFYLEKMQTAITEYPDVQFAFITGHAEGGGEGDSSDSRNEIIRDFVNNNVFCETHQCILFDFADMENYDPDNNYFLDKYVTDALNYNTGNWGVEYLGRHPIGLNADLTDYINGGCSHSESPYEANVNCALKGQATWWMMARMAGWDGTPSGECL
jgi:hypothetical protein